MIIVLLFWRGLRETRRVFFAVYVSTTTSRIILTPSAVYACFT
uniref:Uncharacterized protein n=1 Tax=Anguilla anguilla TaxID=7936 RepID=A0A0E9RYP8_ANGAN